MCVTRFSVMICEGKMQNCAIEVVAPDSTSIEIVSLQCESCAG